MKPGACSQLYQLLPPAPKPPGPLVAPRCLTVRGTPAGRGPRRLVPQPTRTREGVSEVTSPRLLQL